MATRFQTKQDHILRTARRVVSDGGFRTLQMLTVAAAAGVAVGSVYRYYASKAELCAALVARVSERELEVLREIAAADGPPPQRLAAAVATFARRALQVRKLAYAMIAEPVDEAVDQVRLRYRAAISEVFEALIAEGVGDGSFRACVPRVAACCIVGAFMEALVGPLAPEEDDDQARDADFVDEIAGFCVHAVLAEAARPALSIGAVPRNPSPGEIR
jgi:AcrR family transcriptional regulator